MLILKMIFKSTQRQISETQNVCVDGGWCVYVCVGWGGRGQLYSKQQGVQMHCLHSLSKIKHSHSNHWLAAISKHLGTLTQEPHTNHINLYTRMKRINTPLHLEEKYSTFDMSRTVNVCLIPDKHLNEVQVCA